MSVGKLWPPWPQIAGHSYHLLQGPVPERLLPSTPPQSWEPGPVAVHRRPPPRDKQGVKLLGPQQTTPILTC